LCEKTSGSPHGKTAVDYFLLGQVAGSGRSSAQVEGIESEFSGSAVSVLLALSDGNSGYNYKDMLLEDKGCYMTMTSFHVLSAIPRKITAAKTGPRYMVLVRIVRVKC
jgi:hypothetical protein